MEDQQKNPNKNQNIIIFVVIIIIFLIIGPNNKDKKVGDIAKNTTEETSQNQTPLSEKEIKAKLDEVLEVLMSIHYISLNEQETVNPDTVILDELTESMNDLNKLKGLLYKTEELSKSTNEIIAVTGLGLNTTSLELINAYTLWINYLRGVDLNNPDVSEFQYQLALFGSSTHDSYLNMSKSVVLLPMITVKFGENGSPNSVNENLKEHFLSKIDELFRDILVDSDLFYARTKNRYVVAVIINQYKNFFTK